MLQRARRECVQLVDPAVLKPVPKQTPTPNPNPEGGKVGKRAA